jgi:alpha-beta hydrolase superfamily lysophospholipase
MKRLPAPIFFGPAARPCFGCLHGGEISGAPFGVVICSPFGREEVSAFRSLKAFAVAIEQAGMPVLRFDYDGCGDSAGDDLEPDRVEQWTASVADAIDEIKRLTGVTRVVLLGVRLGVLLGALAARGRTDVVGLAAIAPVVRGRSFVREFVALARASRDAEDAILAPDADMEAGGFVLSGQTRTALSAMDLGTMTLDIARVLVIERDDMAGSQAWAEALRAQGLTVDALELPGYSEMMLDPHATKIPEQMIERVVDWLGETSAGMTADATAPSRQAGLSETVLPAGAMNALPVSEAATWIDHQLFGILTRPVQAAPGASPANTVVLLNAGATRHVGPNRMHVELARQWAARGVWVLRLDIAGLGESPAPVGCDENIVYTPYAVDDLRRTLHWLRTASGGAPCTVVGLCSGAYHAFKAAAAGDKIKAIVAINPLTFFWKDDMPLDPPLPAHRVIGEAARYQRAVLEPTRWLKLLRGQVNLGRALQVVSMRVTQKLQSKWREVARFLRMPLKDDLGVELDAAIRHAVELQFVFAADDPGGPMLWTEGGSVARRLAQQQQLGTVTLDRADHTFTKLEARKRLMAVLDEIVLR